MKLTEIRDRLDEVIDEFGDMEVYLVDALEPTWRNPVTAVEYEAERQAVSILSEA